MTNYAAIAKEEEDIKKKPAIDYASIAKKTAKSQASMVGQKELGEPGLKSTFARFNLARADTFEEKLKLFQNQYPEGELFRTPGGELLFREDPSKPFAKTDDPGFEPVNDIVDFLGGEVGPILGEIAAMAPQGKGLNLIQTLSRLFLGGAAGEMTEQGIQSAEGIQSQTPKEVTSQAIGAGMESAAFGGIGYGVGKAFDVVRGAGSVGLQEGAQQAMNSIESLKQRTGIEVPGLTPGQASDNPLIQKIEGQAGATLPTIGRYIAHQQRNLVNVLKTMRSKPEINKLLSGDLAKAHDAINNDILKKARVEEIELGDVGKGIQKGIKDWEMASKYIVDEAYSDARKIVEPNFDISSLKAIAQEIQAGKMVPTEQGPMRLGFSLPSDLNNVIDIINRLSPDLPKGIDAAGNEIAALDQLRAVRTMLWDLKTVPPGTVQDPAQREMSRMAGRLYSELSDIVKNPINASPEFKAAWKKADEAAAKRFDTKEKLFLIQAAKSEAPTKLADRVLKPKEVDNLKILRSTLDNESYGKIQQVFKKNIVGSKDILGELDKYDKPTLRMLISPEEESALRNVGQQMKKLQSIGIQEALQKNTRSGELIRELMYSGNTAKVDELAKVVRKAGKESSIARGFRSGLLDQIIKNSERLSDKGQMFIDGKRLSSEITLLRERGLTQFLTPEDIRTLRDIENIAPLIQKGVDTGTSIQAASAASGFRGVLTGDVSLDAVRTIVEQIGMGRFLTSNFGKKLLVGSGGTKTDKQVFALTAAILGQSIADVEEK